MVETNPGPVGEFLVYNVHVHVGGSSKDCTLMIFIFQSIKVGVAFCFVHLAIIIIYHHIYRYMQVNYVAAHSQVRTAICVSEAIKIYFKNKVQFLLEPPTYVVAMCSRANNLDDSSLMLTFLYFLYTCTRTHYAVLSLSSLTSATAPSFICMSSPVVRNLGTCTVAWCLLMCGR